MLDQQDIKQIREVVREEISGTNEKVSVLETKTSNIEKNVSSLQQDVSILKQDVSELKQGQKDLFSYMNVLHENIKSEFKLVVENLGSLIKESLPPVQHHVYENHENRITRLEVAFTKNMARKKKKSA
jgi:predicted nuclease with TOPRIM domain